MFKLTSTFLITLLILSSQVFSETKIAVLDYRMALLETDIAKQYLITSETKVRPQLNKLDSLKSSAREIQEKLNNTGINISQSERERLELIFNQNIRDIRLKNEELMLTKNSISQEMLKLISPKIDSAISFITTLDDYDLVLYKDTIIYNKPQYDITRRVIERVNQLK